MIVTVVGTCAGALATAVYFFSWTPQLKQENERERIVFRGSSKGAPH